MEEGTKVEARYRGGTRYFPGRIGRANRDGTFDIDYDDGEKDVSTIETGRNLPMYKFNYFCPIIPILCHSYVPFFSV